MHARKSQLREALETSTNSTVLDEEDPFFALLHIIDPYSHAADVYRLIGPESFAKLLDLFDGMTIRLPSKKRLARAVRDQSAFYEYHVLRENSDDVCSRYGIDPVSLAKIVRDLRGIYSYERIPVGPGLKHDTSRTLRRHRKASYMAKDKTPPRNVPKGMTRLVPFPGRPGSAPSGGPSQSTAVVQEDEIQKSDPTKLLEAMSRWLIGGSADDDLQMMRSYLADHKRRHEVFAVGLANVRAMMLPKIVSALHDQVLDLLLDPVRVRTMRTQDRIRLAELLNKMADSGFQAQWDFHLHGPSDLPPLDDSGTTMPEKAKEAESVFSRLEQVSPRGRDRIRSAFSAILQSFDGLDRDEDDEDVDT